MVTASGPDAHERLQTDGGGIDVAGSGARRAALVETARGEPEGPAGTWWDPSEGRDPSEGVE
jgi:hypothetical protein